MLCNSFLVSMFSINLLIAVTDALCFICRIILPIIGQQYFRYHYLSLTRTPSTFVSYFLFKISRQLRSFLDIWRTNLGTIGTYSTSTMPMHGVGIAIQYIGNHRCNQAPTGVSWTGSELLGQGNTTVRGNCYNSKCQEHEPSGSYLISYYNYP